jgi:lysyl-tRNA synthetase class 1
MGVLELAELLPPEIIKYLLLRPDIDENIDIDPTPQNLLRAVDDFSSAAELGEKLNTPGSTELTRADRKRALAASLSTEKLMWKKPFSDYLLRYQIYGDMKKTGEALGDTGGARYLEKYVKAWVAKGFAPEDYQFTFSPVPPTSGAAKQFFLSLAPTMSSDDIHNLVFETAKKNGVQPAQLFKEIYLSLIKKERGPRLGKLVEALGVSRVKAALVP